MMFTLLFAVENIILTYIFHKEIFIFFQILYQKCQKNNKDFWHLYKSIKNTQNVTGTQHPFIKTLEIVGKMYWLRFIQKINGTIMTKSNHKNTVIYSYVLRNKKYMIPIRYSEEPKNIVKITNENGEDITQEILPYMGPSHNWHGFEFTPYFWGYKNMYFVTEDSGTIMFKEHEKIDVSPEALEALELLDGENIGENMGETEMKTIKEYGTENEASSE